MWSSDNTTDNGMTCIGKSGGIFDATLSRRMSRNMVPARRNMAPAALSATDVVDRDIKSDGAPQAPTPPPKLPKETRAPNTSTEYMVLHACVYEYTHRAG